MKFSKFVLGSVPGNNQMLKNAIFGKTRKTEKEKKKAHVKIIGATANKGSFSICPGPAEEPISIPWPRLDGGPSAKS